IVGTGLDYRKTITSPNGLWELSLLVEGNYDESLKLILVNNTITRGTFLGSPDQPRINSRSYMDPFAVGTPIFDTNWLDFDMSSQWKATVASTNTSIPDLSDNSTWTWVMNVTAHGPSLLTKPVPETGGIACLALAAGLLLFFRPRKEKAWTS